MQLITIGAEGFFGPNSTHSDANPAQWAEISGQTFSSNHAVKVISFWTTQRFSFNRILLGHLANAPNRVSHVSGCPASSYRHFMLVQDVDFATVHVWPDTWNRYVCRHYYRRLALEWRV